MSGYSRNPFEVYKDQIICNTHVCRRWRSSSFSKNVSGSRCTDQYTDKSCKARTME